MRRGRPNQRKVISSLILELLSDSLGRSIHSLRTEISKKLGREVSWNTVQKYLQELVEMGKVRAISVPHSKIEGKEGLTVYTIKR